MITHEPDDDDENTQEFDLAGITVAPQHRSLRPTLKEVRRKMVGFDESIIQYMYHHMNGREEEARTYLEEWEDEQARMREEFATAAALQQQQEPASNPEWDKDFLKIDIEATKLKK